MQQIIPPSSLIQKIVGQQKADRNSLYRLSTHQLQLELPEGVLLYHTLTGELFLLSTEEAEKLNDLPSINPLSFGSLIACHFLVPHGFDDIAFAKQTKDIALLFTPRERDLTEYLIFLTTACNARCFYCFEAGIEKATMSEETAKAAGAYIADHCGGKPVNLVWYGGEPLLNVKAIDAMADTLRQHGVEFRSRIDTNGYLFDESLARRVKEDWGLYEAQITLDGTEDIYNKRKNFVNAQGSPYQRVLQNISWLLDAGVQVDVRLNVDEGNERDLYALCDKSAKLFEGKPGFAISPRLIIENKGTQPHSYTEDERYALVEKIQSLWDYLDERGLSIKRSLSKGPVLYSCWSDKANATTITPDGKLGRCESRIDKGIWGSVFSDERNEDVLAQWRESRPATDSCYTCPLYARCIRLKQCAIHPAQCSSLERTEMEIRLKRSILGSYNEWKKNQLESAESQ